MKVIGLCGPKGSGKTTLARLLGRKSYHRVSFSYTIKVMLDAILNAQGVNIPKRMEMLYGDEKEIPTKYLCDKTPRWAMQTLGTEWGRNLIGENLWTNIWLEKVKAFDRIVADDVRFMSEVRAVQSLNGTIIRIERPSITAADPHESEQGDFSRMGITIHNTGRPEHMLDQLPRDLL